MRRQTHRRQWRAGGERMNRAAASERNTRKFGERLLQCERGAGWTTYLISVLIRRGSFLLFGNVGWCRSEDSGRGPCLVMGYGLGLSAPTLARHDRASNHAQDGILILGQHDLREEASAGLRFVCSFGRLEPRPWRRSRTRDFCCARTPSEALGTRSPVEEEEVVAASLASCYRGLVEMPAAVAAFLRPFECFDITHGACFRGIAGREARFLCRGSRCRLLSCSDLLWYGLCSLLTGVIRPSVISVRAQPKGEERELAADKRVPPWRWHKARDIKRASQETVARLRPQRGEAPARAAGSLSGRAGGVGLRARSLDHARREGCQAAPPPRPPATLFSPHAQYATRFSLRFVVSRPGRPLDDVCISRELLPPFPGRTRLETAAHTKAPSSFHSPGDGIICYSPTYLLDRSQLHESSVEQSARPRPLEMPGRRGRSRLSKQ
ncbi:hypothetical protein C7M84_018276 [Penaeus vannamei]|uniref:Uncharacterized protein n=1 Tax=Penaeus vannamei TaxID=6689 RepID=A0A3R7P8H7_PENVA|nr:hypothetical protein C7M84_018276 [Penaeus vannamei]